MEYTNTFIDNFLNSNFLKNYVCEKCGDVVYKSIFAFFQCVGALQRILKSE